MKFKNNKYTTWYNEIVSRGKSRGKLNEGYMERHHILPKSLGGSDDDSNLVYLTAREHYLCHRFLVRMCVVPKEKKSMAWALHLMMHKVNPYQDRYLPKSRTYELVREEFKRIQKETPYVRTAEHSAKIAAANSKRLKGTKFSDEVKAKMSASHKGKTSPRKGVKLSDEIRERMRQAQAYRKKS